jgi:hypothetical protein
VKKVRGVCEMGGVLSVGRSAQAVSLSRVPVGPGAVGCVPFG